MALEIELKLEIDPSNIPLLLDHPLFSQADTHSVNQVTIYYDTPETALRKQGWTLRVRKARGKYIQTVKPVTGEMGLLAREETEDEVSTIRPDLTLLADHPLTLLLNETQDPQLEPFVRSDVTRVTTSVDRAHSRIELDLDHGSINAGGRSVEFAELELELVEGSPASLIITARRLADDIPLRLGVLTKAERGFRLAAKKLGKISKADTVHVQRDMTVGEAFAVIVQACLKHYRLNESLVIRKCKAEALHQCRVATRRLRSAFSLFIPAIEDVEYQHLRQELRWFSSQLGDARNLDVYLKRELTEDERFRALSERDIAYDHVADAMNSRRFRHLMIDLLGWTFIGSWRAGKAANRSVRTFATKRLDRLWRSITMGGTQIADLDEKSRHRLRIQIKKIRYAIEFLHDLFPSHEQAEKKFALAVCALQESLGNLNDLATAREIGEESPAENWLIGSYEEQRHLKAAEHAYRNVLSVGTFWREEKADDPVAG